MKRVLFALSLLLLTSFIVTHNLIGSNFDMSVYDPLKEGPVSQAFKKPELHLATGPEASFIEGEVLVLSATAFGGGVTYQWFFNDEPIDQAYLNLLLIHGIQVAQSGVYKVVAKNSFGQTTESVKVEILPKEASEDLELKILSHSPGSLGKIGEPYSLFVSASGEKLTYRWRKNGLPIVNATSSRLVFLELLRTDSGEYTVEVWHNDSFLEKTMFIDAKREHDLRDSS